MEFINTLSGSAPLIKRLQASSTMATAGIQVLGGGVSSTDFGSVIPGTQSAVAAQGSMAGVTLDTTGTVAATGTVEADILVSVIINADAIFRAKMTNGGTSDTALTADDTTAASADGTVLTGVVTLDDSLVWGYAGSNVGIYRRADDTSGSVAINFPSAVGSGDTYLVAQCYPMIAMDLYVDLSDSFDQVDASAAVVDANNYIIVDVETNGGDQDGINNSYYHLVQMNHMLAGPSHRGV